MENLKQTITEVKTHDGEHRAKEIIRESSITVTRFSWPAIFAGVLVTAVSQLLLSLLGVGIGLATINPVEEVNPMQGLGIASIVWWTVSMFISLFLGGWTTGKIVASKFRGERSLHGLLTWATFTVLSFFILTTSVGALISGAGRVVGSALTAGAGMADIDITGFINEARNTMQSPTAPTGERNTEADERTGREIAGENDQQFLGNVENFFRGGDIKDQESREAIVNSMVNRGMSRAEANAKVDNWIRNYEEMKAKAEVKAEQAAQATSTASIVLFFALLIGALVTIWGARVSPEEDEFQPITVD